MRKRALYVRTKPKDCLKEAVEYCKKEDIELTVINRLEDMPINTIPHEQFLELLKWFDYYLDFKGLTSKSVLSVSGIEAIESGCVVITDTKEEVVDFKTTSFEDYIKLYRTLLISSK